MMMSEGAIALGAGSVGVVLPFLIVTLRWTVDFAPRLSVATAISCAAPSGTPAVLKLPE